MKIHVAKRSVYFRRVHVNYNYSSPHLPQGTWGLKREITLSLNLSTILPIIPLSMPSNVSTPPVD